MTATASDGSVTVEITSTREVTISKREIDVIGGIARGLTFDEIGERLGISGRTAQSYGESARKKLGVRHARLLPAALADATDGTG